MVKVGGNGAIVQCPSLRQYAIGKWGLPEYTAADMVTVARPDHLVRLKFLSCCRLFSAVRPRSRNFVVFARSLLLRTKPNGLISQREVQIVKSKKRLQLPGHSRSTRTSTTETKIFPNFALALTRKPEKTWNAFATFSRRKKVERAMKRSTVKREKLGTCQIRKFTRTRRKLPARVEHTVNLRDQAQCTHVDHQGRRCPNRRWLQRHHLKPVSMGGDDSAANLRSLCSGHHRLVHFQEEENLS